MSRAPIELDFFRMEKEALSAAPTRRRSFQDLQRAVSKLDPTVLKSIFASRAVDLKLATVSVPSGPRIRDEVIAISRKKPGFTAFDDYAKPTSSAPMTIFCNGTLTVFDLSPCQGKDITQVAQPGISKTSTKLEPDLSEHRKLLDSFTKDMPIARRKSLLYFLEKRKQRLTLASSRRSFCYHYPYLMKI